MVDKQLQTVLRIARALNTFLSRPVSRRHAVSFPRNGGTQLQKRNRSLWNSAATVIAFTALWLAADFCVVADEADCRKLLRDVAETYGVQIVPAEGFFRVRSAARVYFGREASPDDVNDYIPLLVREFFLYPVDFIRRSKLKRIVLCRIFHDPRIKTGGAANPAAGTIYLNVSHASKNRRHAGLGLHHEVFHFVDHADDNRLVNDERWASLNRPGFEYGIPPPLNADDELGDVSGAPAGFVTHYAATALEEDKAETFSNLIMDGAYVERRSKKDRILSAKIVEMKHCVRVFCDDIDESFWRSANSLPRPPAPMRKVCANEEGGQPSGAAKRDRGSQAGQPSGTGPISRFEADQRGSQAGQVQFQDSKPTKD